ncbi:P-loop containing nucleoside triphosphate hydrolase protein [Suillus paluster]|uniref:P-loop containing nucleoside triphosphate hydrolase protein n=1 Tax=Suillus paluster TaxID=48578 RepID=UPI001B85F970|nr:P-loop containing nucleoside triphosphate hydrolase protein [Suillus paluster]KAG1720682.1 P-loop containing nucleoside triphosphate hydrolase protein [Suillus paluster]
MATKNIVLFGESGVGKSSIINLLAGRKVAQTSPDAKHCTLRYKSYEVIIGNVPYRIYDTAGVDGDRMDPIGFLDAVTNAHKLMKELKEKGGPHLLLYCMKAGRIQPSFATNYRLFYEFFFEEKIPVALVVTHLEREDPMDEWYTRNKGSFERHAVKCIDYACITAAENLDPRYKKKYSTSREVVGDLIRRHVHEVENWDGGEGWLSSFIGKLKDLLTGRPSKSDFLGVLTKRCGMEESLAKDDRRTKNIVVFGAMGAGKSSLVNLIADKHIAKTGSNLERCTLTWTKHVLPKLFSDGEQYNLFDTMGIENPELEAREYHESIKNASRLLRALDSCGGTSLLVYCIRKGRVSSALQSNYQLFLEVLYQRRVPIVMVVTCLEGEDDMEAWWTRNYAELEKHQIVVQGHACVTTLTEADAKYRASREAVRNLIRENAAVMPVLAGWKQRGQISAFMRRFRLHTDPEEKALQKKLEIQCGMKKGLSSKVAKTLMYR